VVDFSQKIQNTIRIDPETSPIPWVLPLLLYMAIAAFSPKFDTDVTQETTTQGEVDPGSAGNALTTETDVATSEMESPSKGKLVHKTNKYLVINGLQLLTIGSLIYFWWPIYKRHFPLKVGWWWIPTGVFGVVLWIGLCELQIEAPVLEYFGWDVARPSFNPFESIESRGMLFVFLLLRFAMLAAIVPLAEEIFIRGFLVRITDHSQWWKSDLTKLASTALVVASVYGAVSHPGEIVAAIAWFSLVTWLMVKSGSIWPCVLAHAVTNFLLGIYVISFGQWHLW